MLMGNKSCCIFSSFSATSEQMKTTGARAVPQYLLLNNQKHWIKNKTALGFSHDKKGRSN
jgi:hypothetical protein